MTSLPTLYRRGTVHSDADPFATAILVADGVVAWLGDEEGADVQARRDPAVVSVDLAGALLAPGFVDAVGASGVDAAALAALGVVAELADPGADPDGQRGAGPAPTDPGARRFHRAAWARVIAGEAALDALPGGTVACLDPSTLGEVDLAARAGAGVPLALGMTGAAGGPWRRVQHALAGGLSARAAFVAHTRGAWRASDRPEGPVLGRLHIGAPASFAVWEVEELVTQAADARRSAWSLDARSGVPPLPRLGSIHDEAWAPPRCLLTVADGVVLHEA